MSKLIINFQKTVEHEALDYYFKHVIRKAISTALVHEGFDSDCEVSVTLCDNDYIKRLNSKYRNKNSATDVLSFPMYDFSSDEETIPEGELIPLGDIVISLERAAKQAEELSNPFLTEVAFLTVHSILHLLGYDHERSKEDDEAQCSAQREIMAALDI